MNISAIIAATILVAAVGLFIGVFLGAAGKKFAVEIDEKEVAIREALPGNNCGGCGYPGCDGLAAAIAKGEAPVNRCPVGGEPVGKIIAGIMGQAAVETARQVAHVKCSGTCEKAKEEYIYTGVEDCEMLPFVPNGGAKTCTYGCCGFGSCVKVCPFDAIHIVDGIAVGEAEAEEEAEGEGEAEGEEEGQAEGEAEILYQWGIPSICRNGRGTELQYDRWKNQQSATEKGESRSTKEEEICPFAFV